MDVLLLFVHSRVPTKAVRMDLIALGDVGDRCVDEVLPVFNICVPQTLRILTGEGDDRCPHISRVPRHLCHGILQRRDLPVGVPQAVFAQRFYAGAVCDIVKIVFPAIHGLDKVLVDLRDERKGSLPVGCVCIVLMLRQLPCLREAAEQTLDVLLLFLRDRKMGIVILEELHAFTGGEVAGTMGQPSGISAALHVWRDKYQPRHVSSGSCRWTSWASSNLI